MFRYISEREDKIRAVPHQVQQFALYIVVIPLTKRWKTGGCDTENGAVTAERAVGNATTTENVPR